jgi:proteasome lid subunit RPN8/RPN11
MFADIVDVELLRKEAVAAYPNETLWLVTEAKGCYQVENIHEDPENFFRAPAQDSAAAMQEGLLAVVHSHCDQAEVPSQQDMELQMKLQVPCGILSTDGENSSQILWYSDEVQPLEGRSFSHGVADCYSIVKDYYKLKGVDLGEVPRSWQWWETGDNFLEELFEDFGFYEISASEVREGDVWLAQIRSPVIHHCGIILDNDLILHHPGSHDPIDRTKLSIKEPIYRYLPHIKKFLRHHDYSTSIR